MGWPGWDRLVVLPHVVEAFLSVAHGPIFIGADVAGPDCVLKSVDQQLGVVGALECGVDGPEGWI